MMDATVSTPSSRWMSLFREYQGLCFLVLDFDSIGSAQYLIFSHIPNIGYHMSILVAILVYKAVAYWVLPNRIFFRAASKYIFRNLYCSSSFFILMWAFHRSLTSSVIPRYFGCVSRFQSIPMPLIKKDCSFFNLCVGEINVR